MHDLGATGRAAGLHRRPARRRRHRPRAPGRADRRRPAGRPGRPWLGLRALAHLGRRRPRARRALEQAPMTHAARPLARRVRRARHGRAVPVTTPWPSPRAWSPGTTWRSRLISRRDDEARWTGAGAGGPGARRGSGGAPGPARLRAGRVSRRCCARSGVAVHHGPHYTMPSRAPVPCAVTIHDCTFFDHPEWHVRTKAVFFRRAIRRAALEAGALDLRQPGDGRAPARLVPGAGTRRGGAPRGGPRTLRADRAASGRRSPGARGRRGAASIARSSSSSAPSNPARGWSR